MKHAGSDNDLRNQAEISGTSLADPLLLPIKSAEQSRTSILVALAFGLFLIAAVLDAPVRALAESLDPSLKVVMG
jgi:hypothetical protein